MATSTPAQDTPATAPEIAARDAAKLHTGPVAHLLSMVSKSVGTLCRLPDGALRRAQAGHLGKPLRGRMQSCPTMKTLKNSAHNWITNGQCWQLSYGG